MLGKRRKTREICAFCHGFHVNAKDLCDFWAMKPSLQGECQGRSAHLSRVSCTVHPVNSYLGSRFYWGKPIDFVEFSIFLADEDAAPMHLQDKLLILLAMEMQETHLRNLFSWLTLDFGEASTEQSFQALPIKEVCRWSAPPSPRQLLRLFLLQCDPSLTLVPIPINEYNMEIGLNHSLEGGELPPEPFSRFGQH